jgi:curved DNA-binding protein CbpA
MVPISDELINALHEEHTIRSIINTDDACRIMNKNFYNFDFDMSKNKSVKVVRNDKHKAAADDVNKLIARQYRQVTVHLHPDHHGEIFRQEFDALQVAYEILKDAESRGDYVDSMVTVIEKCKKMRMGPESPFSAGFMGDDGFHQDKVRDSEETCTDLELSRPTRLVERSRPQKSLEQKTIELLQMANTSFISDYMKKKEKKDSNWRRYKEKTGKKARLYLEASMFGQPPKALRVDKGDGRKRLNGTLKRTVRLPPLSQSTGPGYQELCRGVSVYAESHTAGDPDHLLLELKGDNLKAAFDVGDSGWITTDIRLPDFGTFNVYWFATLEDASSETASHLVNTPKSSLTQILCETSRAFDARKRLPGLVTEAKKVCGSLRSACRQWDNASDSVVVTSSSRKLQDLERKFSHLDRQISKANEMAEQMYITFEDIGWRREEAFSRQKELNELVQSVAEASLVKDRASSHIVRSQKRHVMKSFKQLVVDMIESNDMSSWIQSVEEKEIIALGGDMNRLYQLLMEGKAYNSSSIDYMTSLLNASNRSDLFSKKQCKALLAKSMKMDQSLQPIFQQIRAANNGVSKDAEVILGEEIMPLETPVALTGLKERSDLNGQNGKYMGIGDCGRFNILVNGNLYALKLENFVVNSPLFQHEFKSNVQESWKDCAPKVVQKAPKKATTQISESSTSKQTLHGKHTSFQGKAKPPKGKTSNKMFKEEIIWLPKELQGKFIGTKAQNIFAMATATQTRMYVDGTVTEKPGYSALRIEGPPNNIEIAKERVQLFLDKASDDKKKMTQPKTNKVQDAKKAIASASEKVYIQGRDPKIVMAPQSNKPQVPTDPSMVASQVIKPHSAIARPKQAPPPKHSSMAKILGSALSSTKTIAAIEKSSSKDVNVNSDTEDNHGWPIVSERSMSPSEEISALVLDTKVVEGDPASKNPVFGPSRVFTPITVPQSISVLTEPEELSAVSHPVRVSPASVTNEAPFFTPPGFKSKRSRVEGTAEDLLVFLQQNASCIKGSPEEFHEYLVESDVKCVSDLNDACKDKFFLPLMRSDWLKGFKIKSFIAAVSEGALGRSFVPSTSMPAGFGNLNAPLTDQAAIAMQQLNYVSGMGSHLPLVPTETGSEDHEAGENGSLFFLSSWK